MPELLEPIVEEIIQAPSPSFTERLVPAPWTFDFAGEDGLRLTVHNSQSGVVVAVHYRMHRPNQTSHATAQRFTPATDRSASSTEFEIGEGFLHNVSVFAESGSPQRGQTFVRLQIIRGRGAAAVVLGTIVQGYITGQQDRAWPGSPLEGSLEGDGYIRTITGTDTTNNECSETVPTGARWELLEWAVNLTTDATVDTRRCNLTYDDGATRYMRSTNPGTLGASLTATFYFAQGMTLDTVIGGESAMAGLPTRIVLRAGHRIRTMSTGTHPGDDYGAPLFVVREWLEAQ